MRGRLCAWPPPLLPDWTKSRHNFRLISWHFLLSGCYAALTRKPPKVLALATPLFFHQPQKAIINEAVDLVLADSLEVARDLLKKNLIRAAKVKVDGLSSKKTVVAQAAATEILDRHFGKPKQSIEATVTADVTVKGYMVVSPDGLGRT